MGTKNEPGNFDCYHNALPDEPMFILLARDPSAPDLVEDWATERQRQIDKRNRPESDQAMVDEAVQCAANMRHWRVINNGAWRSRPLPKGGAETTIPVEDLLGGNATSEQIAERMDQTYSDRRW